MLSSSTGEQKSWVRRDKTMSIFTYHVMEALTGHAPHADGEKVVYVTDVMKWASQKVPQTAQAEYEEAQTPQIAAVGDFAVAQLIGGKGVAKGLDEDPPDPLQPLPVVDTGGREYAAGDMDKSIKVTFKQKNQKVSGKLTNIGVIQGNVGQIGDIINQHVTKDKAAQKELEDLIAQLNELLQQTPAAQEEEAEQVAEATELLIQTAASEKPNLTMVQALGEGLKQTARKLGDNLPGIIELTTKIATAAAALAGAMG